MSRITDVLDELSKLGAVGGAKEVAPAPAPVRERAPARAPAPAPAPAREEPVDATEADDDVEDTIAALTEGFRASEEEAPVDDSEEPVEDEGESQEDAPAQEDAADISDLVVLAAQKLEEIEEATDQLRRLLKQMQER